MLYIFVYNLSRNNEIFVISIKWFFYKKSLDFNHSWNHWLKSPWFKTANPDWVVAANNTTHAMHISPTAYRDMLCWRYILTTTGTSRCSKYLRNVHYCLWHHHLHNLWLSQTAVNLCKTWYKLDTNWLLTECLTSWYLWLHASLSCRHGHCVSALTINL